MPGGASHVAWPRTDVDTASHRSAVGAWHLRRIDTENVESSPGADENSG